MEWEAKREWEAKSQNTLVLQLSFFRFVSASVFLLLSLLSLWRSLPLLRIGYAEAKAQREPMRRSRRLRQSERSEGKKGAEAKMRELKKQRLCQKHVNADVKKHSHKEEVKKDCHEGSICYLALLFHIFFLMQHESMLVTLWYFFFCFVLVL
uniref:Transmembrane protein n=1 Tax=Pediastrum duplex TaxID=3105 RepID=A0A1W5RML5_PEDDU|nr:hypothetical protein [Pediastrum duplex]AQU64445.1 hypothetical protein [Pediastrum duplex]